MKKKESLVSWFFLVFLQNGIGKDQKCNVFPESRYVNSNPAIINHHKNESNNLKWLINKENISFIFLKVVLWKLFY